MLVEVPLEDNRSGRRPAHRAESERIGHLHQFDRTDVHALVAAAGLGVERELSDPLPVRAPRLLRRRAAAARARAALKWAVRTAVWKFAPKGGEKWFTLHYAVVTGPSRGQDGS